MRARKEGLVGVAIEVRGRGSGRLRRQVLPDPSESVAVGINEDDHGSGRDCAHGWLPGLQRV